MRAAIDIGSNSIRYLDGTGRKRSVITKLADGIETAGVLSPAGVSATVEALKEFAALGSGLDIIAFATEAVRRAKDGAEFIRLVKRETGIDVKLLSPEDEARLALFGAKKPSGAVSVCDLGGGSMELISAADGVTPEYIKSLPLGVVVLKNRFNGDYRKAADECAVLVKDYGATKDYPLVVMGGSACNIAAAMMDLPVYDATKVNGYRITARALDDFMPVLMSKKLAVLRPVCARRADTVAYGAIALLSLLNHMGLTEFTVSDSSNLEAAAKGCAIL